MRLRTGVARPAVLARAPSAARRRRRRFATTGYRSAGSCSRRTSTHRTTRSCSRSARVRPSRGPRASRCIGSRSETFSPPILRSSVSYPSLGVDANALYIGCNMFDGSFTFYQYSSAYVIRKSSVLSGGPMVVTGFSNMGSTNNGPYAPRGVDNDDPTWTEGYFIGTDPGILNRISIRKVLNPGGTPTLGPNIILPVFLHQPAEPTRVRLGHRRQLANASPVRGVDSQEQAHGSDVPLDGALGGNRHDVHTAKQRGQPPPRGQVVRDRDSDRNPDDHAVRNPLHDRGRRRHHQLTSADSSIPP